jgi:hypothetical protein
MLAHLANSDRMSSDVSLLESSVEAVPSLPAAAVVAASAEAPDWFSQKPEEIELATLVVLIDGAVAVCWLLLPQAQKTSPSSHDGEAVVSSMAMRPYGSV